MAEFRNEKAGHQHIDGSEKLGKKIALDKESMCPFEKLNQKD